MEAAAVLGNGSASAELWPVMQQWRQEGGVLFWTFGLTEKLAGIAAAAGGRWDAAEGHFGEALRLADGLPHRVDQAEVRRWHARMLLDRDGAGDRDRARALLAEACVLYEQIGMPFHRNLADAMRSESS